MLKKYILYIMISLSFVLQLICPLFTTYAVGNNHADDTAVIIQEMKKSFVLAGQAVKQVIEMNIPNLNMAFSSLFARAQISHEKVSAIRAGLIIDLFKRCNDAGAQKIFDDRIRNQYTKSIACLPQAQQQPFIYLMINQQPPRITFDASMSEPLGTYLNLIEDTLRQDGDRVLREAFNFFKSFYPELDESILTE